MPIRKFRRVAEMSAPSWREPGDPELWRAVAAVWSFAARAFPRRFPAGVHRHATIEDAKSLRDAWEAADFRRLWARRGVGPD
jgi:hypothetical protein